MTITETYFRTGTASSPAGTSFSTGTASSPILIFFPTNISSSGSISSYRYPQIERCSRTTNAHDFQSSSPPSSDNLVWFPQMLAKINDAEKLEPGWDSYDAPVPSPLAIEYSKNLLFALHGITPRPVDVGPSVMGGMGFTFLSDDKEVFVEIYNNGDIYAMFMDESDTESEPRVDPFRASNEFRYLLSEIGEFLNA